MNIDTFNVLGINVSRDIRPLVYYQNRFSMSLGFMGKNSSIKAGTYYKYSYVIFSPRYLLCLIFFNN